MPEERSDSLGRRSVLRGAAWAVPVLALATATPAHASSVPPVERILFPDGLLGYAYYSNAPSGDGGSGRGAVQIDSAGGSQAGKFFRVGGLLPSDAVQDVFFDFMIATTATLTWYPLCADRGYWSVPQETGTRVINGTTYKVYRSRYQGATPPLVDGVRSYPTDFYFRTQAIGLSQTRSVVAVRGVVLADGTTVENTPNVNVLTVNNSAANTLPGGGVC